MAEQSDPPPHPPICVAGAHLGLDGAVHGGGARLLDAPAAEGFGARGQGRVRDAVGHLVLQGR